MASVFAVSESYGTSPDVTDTDWLNFLSTNTASGSDGTTNTLAAPITVPTGADVYSYERWTRGHWTGSFNGISNVRLWGSATTQGTGTTINAGDNGSQTYTTAVNTASSIATSAIPTVQGSGLDLAYLTNFCDYAVLQLVVANTAGPGYTTQTTISYGWDET